MAKVDFFLYKKIMKMSQNDFTRFLNEVQERDKEEIYDKAFRDGIKAGEQAALKSLGITNDTVVEIYDDPTVLAERIEATGRVKHRTAEGIAKGIFGEEGKNEI